MHDAAVRLTGVPRDMSAIGSVSGNVNGWKRFFGWMKTVGGMRKLRHRGLQLVAWMFTFAAAAYNLVRMRNLTAEGANA